MPQENKKRGRRMKRKHAEDGEDGDGGPGVEDSSKRRKSSDFQQQDDYVPLEVQDESMGAAYPSAEKPFFGMLDAEEQEYFKHADETLEANSFSDEEERQLFLSNVYREAQGKELKIAQSQSCSRLLERLIKVSTAPQLKQLFQAFSGNFIHLISHRFASHCCEALFIQAAPEVTKELLAPAQNGSKASTNVDEVYVSMENLFLHTLAELEGSLGFLITEQYASHVLRILLMVLAGEPFESTAVKHLLHGKSKEGVAAASGDKIEPTEKLRSVPKSFTEALSKTLGESIAGLDTDKLRALATHPNANPTLQLLLKLELTHFGKQRAKDETSIIRTLLPDDPITAESGSASFINGLIYDPIGSHLIEQIVQHAPGKLYKNLNKEFFKERLASYARNEVAGYVVCRVLERMSKDDLFEAHEALIPIIPGLLERNRTQVLRTLIERCVIRDIDTQAIAAQLIPDTRSFDGFDVKSFLKFNPGQPSSIESNGTPHDSVQSSANEEAIASSRPTEPVKVHFNLLAQAMLIVPGSLSSMILDSLIRIDPPVLQQMCKDPIVTRTMQAALTSKNASIIQKRKLIQQLYGNIGDMALDKSASHVVDCVWEGTHGLAFIRERIAEELAENEAQLRDTQHGRAVWRNWKMDLYKRKRHEWIRQSKIKASNDGFQSFSEIDTNKKEDGPGKTPLQLARERHAKNKERQAKASTTEGVPSGRRSGRHGPASGSNAPPTATAST